MALTPDAKRDRQIVNQFLNNGPAQSSGFLGQLDRDIATNRTARRAQMRGARGQRYLQSGLDQIRSIGGSPMTGMAGQDPQLLAERARMAQYANNTPQSIQARAFPSGAGGRQILQQGMGPVPPVGGQQMALGPGTPGGVLTQGPGNAVATGPGQPALGPGASAPRALGPGARAIPPGPIAGTTRAAAASADDFVRIAGEAAVQGSDDAAIAAARQAGQAQAKAGATGLRGVATNLGVNVSKGSLMRGGGAAAGGYVVSQFLDGMNIGGEQSLLDKGGSSAIMGAGLGGGAAMALGLGAGPVGWAALGGAALFAGSRMLWGGDDTKLETATKSVDQTRETITELAGMYGIEGEALDDIMLQYEASTSMLIDQKDTAGLKNFMAGISTNLPALMLQAREEQKAGDQEQKRYEAMMQTQAQFAPIFEQSMNRAAQSNLRATAQANNTANYLDQRQPQLAALYRTTAAQSEAAAANLQAAYAKQMATAPVTTGTTDQLQRQMAQEELMNQQIAQSAQYAGF